MLMHMPTHPDCSRYLHFLIWTPLRHVFFSPSKSTSTSFVSRGPTSHLKNMAVIDAFVSADHCSTPDISDNLAKCACRLHVADCAPASADYDESWTCEESQGAVNTTFEDAGRLKHTLLTGNHFLKRADA